MDTLNTTPIKDDNPFAPTSPKEEETLSTKLVPYSPMYVPASPEYVAGSPKYRPASPPPDEGNEPDSPIDCWVPMPTESLSSLLLFSTAQTQYNNIVRVIQNFHPTGCSNISQSSSSTRSWLESGSLMKTPITPNAHSITAGEAVSGPSPASLAAKSWEVSSCSRTEKRCA